MKRKCIKVGRSNKEPNVQKYFFIVSKAGIEEEKVQRYSRDELRLEVALLKMSPAIYLGKSSCFVQSQLIFISVNFCFTPTQSITGSSKLITIPNEIYFTLVHIRS